MNSKSRPTCYLNCYLQIQVSATGEPIEDYHEPVGLLTYRNRIDKELVHGILQQSDLLCKGTLPQDVGGLIIVTGSVTLVMYSLWSQLGLHR